MISSFLVSVCILMSLGALLHLAWGFLRAALVWAPSGYAGIVTGWYVVECSESAALAVAAALVVSTLVRFAIVTAWMSCFAPRRIVLAAWAEDL
jgi:hypothetical protein